MTDDTQVSPPVAPPTVPGWYAYDGGRQTMVFHLSRDDRRPDGFQWRAFFDNGTTGECEWGYIEQCLSVWNLVPLIPADYRPLAEDVTDHTMVGSYLHFDQRMCHRHSRLGVWACGHPSPDGTPDGTWAIDRECLRSHDGSDRG
jgi:hypothetical protein